MGWLTEHHLAGAVIGLATFLLIGVFHPLVIKGEYYLGRKCVWFFALGGAMALAASFLISDLTLSILSGVLAFSCFWSIHEVLQQEKRVEKGWFPSNPRRRKGKNA